ncbi:MAG TPA: competence/damage-inducible protein A [Solirubrobacterales bacterium]|nr:competence/damage-inducible protein A [Solirubrobacterales bacterium]HMX71253.1 competence/damage-inducible protein A [Solirubrobacterales bacterium]HMY24696.1 competence/damage-inducible protein A [Solirubrobacterales bacterium]HNA23032.1 competence/damage-inducible protein A [Solirubrobacterales bacterium]HNA43391.1 competence/damage-inducible protein A [Solirubrobacterales bacterium]
MAIGEEIFRPGSSSDGEVRAGILVTGTEVLTATIRDENGPWLSEQLSGLGVELVEILVVADHPGDLARGLENMKSAGIDLIITTGGLGPTADDLTAEVVAAFSGRKMELDEEMEARIAAILARFAANTNLDLSTDALNEANRKQAMIPVGAVALDPVGTAPGLIVPGQAEGDPLVLVLPGPPRELKPMWEAAQKEPMLRQVLDQATRLEKYRLRMFGTPESELAMSLREIEGEGLPFDGLEITTCLRKGEVEVDVRYREAAADAAEQLKQSLLERHSRSLYSLDGSTVDEVVAGLLAGRRLGLAESCSAGLLAARIADVPGSSAYFAGGVVCYSNEAKRDLLGVDQALLDEFGAVSAEVAEAMAVGALERFDADVSVAITGIAGPDGGTGDKPVGLVHFNVRTAEGGVRAAAPIIPGGRRDVRERSALVAMHLLREILA